MVRRSAEFWRRTAMLLLIFALGLGLRAHHLGTAPPDNATADEYAWTWSGMTLVNEGTPRSWSWLPAYHHFPIVKWKGSQYHIVQPWLDHPPLYQVFMGVWMRLGGYRDIFAVDLAYMRWSSMLLFMLTFPLLALVLFQTLEQRVALASLLIYSVMPLAVLQSKLVISENLLMPFFLGALYALLRWFEDPRRSWLMLAGLCVFLIPLTKTAGLSLTLVLFALCVLRERWTAVGVIVAATIAGIAGHFLYGMSFSPGLFPEVMKVQSQRFIGFDTIYELLFVNKLVDKPMVCLPCILGVVVLLSELLQGRTNIWALLLVAYTGALAFFADQSYVTGWYALPLFPAIAVGIGKFAVELWDRSNAWLLWIWALFFMAGPLDLLLAGHPDGKPFLRYLYLAIVVLVPLGMLGMRRLSRWSYRGGVLVLFGIQLATDFYQVLSR